MKKRWSVVASALLLTSLVVVADQGQVSATAVTSDSVSQGTPVGTAGQLGYYDGNVTILGSNGEPYQNGNSNTPFKLTTSSTNGLYVYAHRKSVFEYAPEQVAMSGDNNGSGALWHVDEVANGAQPVTGSNGYLMISNTSLPSWIEALHGNPVYVQDAENSTSTAAGESFNSIFKDKSNSEDFNLYDFPAVVADSGDYFISGGSGSGTGPIYVKVTPNPTASLTVSHTSATIGTDETLTATGTVSAYGTQFHYAGVSIVNTTTGIAVPQSDITFANEAGSTSLTPPYSNTPMVEMNTGYGSYTDTMNVNTSQLGAGNYEATYYVSDYRDRFAPSSTVSFVLNSATTPTAGTLTLTASPTSTTVGTAVTLSASYTGAMPPNSAIYLHDLSNDSTLQGSNSAEGTVGQSTFTDTNVVANTAETVEYHAALYVNGTYVDSSDVYVTWSAATASCPTPPSLTANTPAAGATTDAISVYDPSNDALELSVNNGGTLSQSFVYGSTTVDVTGQAGTTYKEERLGSSTMY